MYYTSNGFPDFLLQVGYATAMDNVNNINNNKNNKNDNNNS